MCANVPLCFNASLYFPKKYIVTVVNGTKRLEGIEIKENFATAWSKMSRSNETNDSNQINYSAFYSILYA